MCVSLEDKLHLDIPMSLCEESIRKRCQTFDFVTCTIVIGVLCILGLLGNTASFVVLTKHKSENNTVFLLQCLALSDIVLLATTIVVYSLPGVYPYTHAMKAVFDACEQIKAYMWPVSMIAHTLMVWLTVMVTVTRYLSVCHPTRKTPLSGTRNSIKIQVACISLFSVLYNIPRFFEHQTIRQETTLNDNGTNATMMNFNLGDSQVYQIVYSNLLYFPVMYIIPLMSLGYLNTKLIRGISIIRSKRQSMTGHKAKSDNITYCIIVLVCVFILCQTPALINQIFWAINSRQARKCGHFHFYYTKISDVLVVLNSSTNFIIYCLFGKTFRQIFLETLCMKKVCLKSQGQEYGAGVSEQPLDDICAFCNNMWEEKSQTDENTTDTNKCSCRTQLVVGNTTRTTSADPDRIHILDINGKAASEKHCEQQTTAC